MLLGLMCSAGLLSLYVAAVIWQLRPEGWRRAFVGLRVLFYSYLLLTYLALYEAATAETLGAKLAFLFYLVFALTTLIEIGYLMLPYVRRVFGVVRPTRLLDFLWPFTRIRGGRE
jgi:hypothetical protein